MKKFLFSVVLLVVAVFYARATPQYAYLRFRSALENKDLATVEQTADLLSLSGVVVDVLTTSAEQAATDRAGDVGGALAKLFGAVIGEPLKLAVGPALLDEVRAAITRGDYATHLGSFQYDSPYAAVGKVQTLERSALLEMTGVCKGQPASVKLVLEKEPGHLVNFFAPYRITGVERESLKAMSKVCALLPL